MTPEQIQLVQRTWRHLLPIKDSAAELFYAKLFEIEPALILLFRGDMRTQREKLMLVIDTAVKGLAHIERLVPTIRDLGRRHAGYGVKEEHYDKVGQALLSTLAVGLDSKFTPQAREAWATVYGVLASTMKEGAAMDKAESVQSRVILNPEYSE